MDDIYLLYFCDEWKSVDSYRLYMASIDVEKIVEEVARLVRKGDVEFNRDFEEYDELDINGINDAIATLYITSVEDGEPQF